MQCPVDGETLVMSERSGVEIDYCPKCRGVWLDRGELDKILARAAGDDAGRPVVMQAPGAGPASPPPARPAAAPDLRETPHFPHDHGDRGRDDHRRDDYRRDDDRRSYQGDRRDDDYRDRDRRHDDDHDRYRKKKRESFLSDLFDF